MPLPFVLYASDRTTAIINDQQHTFVSVETTDDMLKALQTMPIAGLVIELDDNPDAASVLEAVKAMPELQAMSVMALVNSVDALDFALHQGVDDIVHMPLHRGELALKIRNMQRLMPQALLGSVDVLTHDFNSPLGITEYSLQLALEILEESDNHLPELRQLIRNVLRGNQRLRFMLFDMLDYFRLAGGVYHVQLSELDLLPIVDRVVTITSHHAHENNISVALDSEADEFFAIADAGLIERAILAVVDTAIKFCQPGTDITLRVAEDHDTAYIKVIDNGQSLVAPFETYQLFEPYVAALLREKGGRSTVAMSLPFLQAAMQAMNGQVEVVLKERQTHVILSLQK